MKIGAETRTAEDQKKFDIQLLSAGTTFDLRFELLISDTDKDTDKLKTALATALVGLTDRQITLGARKRRGFGQCTVSKWEVWKYNLKDKSGLLHGWQANAHPTTNGKETEWKDAPTINSITTLTEDKIIEGNF